MVVTQEEHEWAKREARFKAELDARCRDRDFEETGRRKGFQLGRQLGQLIGRIEYVQKSLQQPLTSQEELLLLPLADLQRRAELLAEQVVKHFSKDH